jgi:hypothetical protein
METYLAERVLGPRDWYGVEFGMRRLIVGPTRRAEADI